MADIEKTIEELKRTEQFLTEYGFDGHIQQVHDAIELLKEQEAVEPIRICTNYEQHWKCGNCNAVISLQDKYCSACGKHILWEGR